MINHLNFSQIFSVFSRREKAAATVSKPLTQEFRFRVFQLCTDTFIESYMTSSPDFWEERHRHLIYLHGRPSLTGSYKDSKRADALTFLSQCNDEHFIDFIEFIFQSEAFQQLSSGTVENQFLNTIDEFLSIDDLPYSLTGFVREEVETSFHGSKATYIHTISYPQVIRRDSEAIHETAIQPTLTLLANPAFKAANGEFLDALKDYREGDYGDCVVKCGSSFESVMKIICEQRGWPPQRDAGKLLNTVLSKTDLPKFLKQPLIQTATIRNELGSAHGAGAEPRDVTQHLAQYTINMTASAILLLVEETKP